MEKDRRSSIATRLALVIGLVASSGTALAAAPAAAGEATSRRQASLDFQIVIPETVRIGAAAPDAQPLRILVSRTDRVEAGRRLITVAKP